MGNDPIIKPKINNKTHDKYSIFCRVHITYPFPNFDEEAQGEV
jgi:hypothetical protein